MLKNKAELLKEEIEGFKVDFSSYMMSEMNFENILDINPAALKLLKRCYTLSDASLELMMQEALAIDEINRKLDLLISSKN